MAIGIPMNPKFARLSSKTNALGLLVVLMGALSARPLVCQQKAPSRRDQEQMVKRYLEVDCWTERGQEERIGILDRLSTVPALDARQLKEWRRKIVNYWSKGRKLEKGGDNWYWPEGKDGKGVSTGRYIIGGKTKKPKGLAINMHGGGVGSGDAGGAASGYGSDLAKLDLLMIAPEVLKKTECGWTDSGTEEFVLDLVDAALRTWKIDPDRVYLVGHSMGGYGSWTLGGHHADRVAAVAPSAGAPTPIRYKKGGPIMDVIEGVVPSLRNVFVAVYQSIDDPQVPPAPNQFAVKLLDSYAKKWGGFEHDYWEVDGRGHAAPPGGHFAHVQKIVEVERQVIPERIVWQPALQWKRQFYYLYWEQPVLHSVLVADLDRKANKVSITCDNPTEGLYVLLDDRVLDLEKNVVVTVNGKETFRGKVQPELKTLLLTSEHPDPELQFIARAPAFPAGG